MTTCDVITGRFADPALPQEPPADLAPAAATVWREIVPRAPWLRLSELAAVTELCGLMAAFRADPAAFEHQGRMIGLASGCGLTPMGRRQRGIE